MNHTPTIIDVAELRTALATLVDLHQDWSAGNAYVRASFIAKNDAAIAVARSILAATVSTPAA